MNSTTLPVRTTDPDTSHQAAAKAVANRPRIRDCVFAVIAEAGPAGITHDALVVAYHRKMAQIHGWPPASASSIRTRCSELVRDDLVESVPDHVERSALGNRARLWRAVID